MIPSFLSSLFSNKKKTSGHKNRNLNGDNNGQPPPSNGQDPVVNSTNNHGQRETVVDRGSSGDHVDHWIHDGGQGQPPSVSGIRPFVASQPSGGNQMSTTAADLPPSLNDVGRRGGSLTGDLGTGKGPAADDEQDLAGMSLVGNKFKEFFPVQDGK